MAYRVLVTGGSGFIGTNLVDSLLAEGFDALSIDIKRPMNEEHNHVFRKVDILDYPTLVGAFNDFAPVYIVHLAARTDLHEDKSLDGYAANTIGVENMVNAIANQTSVKRAIFTSTKLVCPTGYSQKSYEDYCPDTMYGKSKVEGEKIVRSSSELKCWWCIVRPTSIWGPWSYSPHIPYGRFFKMIARGHYFHPGLASPLKSFGYVGNVIFQINKLFDAPPEQIHRKIFYLTDYDVFTIKEWADMISLKLRNRKARTIPEWMVRLLALAGDLMKFCGIREPPFSSFRLKNMRADTTGIPFESMRKITGPLPYSLEQGVEETISWFQKHNLIR